MSLFTYRALNEQAVVVESSISADSLRSARDLLRGRGLVVESITPQGEKSDGRWSILKRRDRHGSKRVEAVRELSTLLAAGIPLLEALDSLVAQQKGRFRDSLMAVRERVAAGSSLAEAMRDQPQVFDELSVQMVEVGENSGTLDVVLDQLAGFSERYMQLKDRVLNALFYPVIVFSLSMGVGVFLMTVVVPMLLDNLLEAGKSIPWPTRVLKAMSDAVRNHGFSMGLIAVAVVAAVIVLLRTDRGRLAWHRLAAASPCRRWAAWPASRRSPEWRSLWARSPRAGSYSLRHWRSPPSRPGTPC